MRNASLLTILLIGAGCNDRFAPPSLTSGNIRCPQDLALSDEFSASATWLGTRELTWSWVNQDETTATVTFSNETSEIVPLVVDGECVGVAANLASSTLVVSTWNSTISGAAIVIENNDSSINHRELKAAYTVRENVVPFEDPRTATDGTATVGFHLEIPDSDAQPTALVITATKIVSATPEAVTGVTEVVARLTDTISN
jgi:hypothetical protein